MRNSEYIATIPDGYTVKFINGACVIVHEKGEKPPMLLNGKKWEEIAIDDVHYSVPFMQSSIYIGK